MLLALGATLSCSPKPPAANAPEEPLVLGASPPEENTARPGSNTPLDALKPCSEDNPEGCTAGPSGRAKLDVNQRYSIAPSSDDPVLGSPDAKVTLVVFSDFECPYCSRLEPVLNSLRTRFGERLRIVWKDLPLQRHRFALSAAVLAREAYDKYGNERFWTVHDELFIHQRQLSDAWLGDFAKTHGLAWPPDARYVPRIQENVQLADHLAINATPTVFVNGRPVVGARDEGAYSDLIVEELDHAR